MHVADEETRNSLAAFLRSNRRRAIAQWEQAVRAIPAAALLDAEELRDHMPALIDRLLDLVEARVVPSTGDLAAQHAIVRMEEGFNLEQVAWEYSALRSTLLRLNEEGGAQLVPGAIVLLNDAIDQAVVRAVSKFHRARVRMLEALERIAQEGLLSEPQPLDALLHRLLRVIQDTVESVDTAVLFLCDGDRLVLRAGVGIEQSLEGTFSLAFGEGFAGTVAKNKKPLFTASAGTDPLVRNPVLKMTGVKALYGVPLVSGDDVIGVAKMGSRTLSDFPADDRQLLRSTADRAAAFIGQRRVAEERELILHILGHDLRSPLNAIVMSANYMKERERLSPVGARTVDRALSAALRMDRLIDDLSDYTKSLATGTLPLVREKLDLYDAAAQIVREVHPRTDRALKLTRGGDTTGEWDRGRVLRATANLVNNALAYGAASTPVNIDVHGDAEWVTLSVHNEGDPIDPELLPHVFEAFKRGKKGAGSGLGLYIVQRMARAHGGSVDVESAAGRGTTFRLRLPRPSSA